MASVIINDDNLKNIAEAIREKGETNETYTPSEMADAIRSISGGGTPNAVQYVSQELTSEQQAQARANIGAQQKLTGSAGQVVGFDANGNAVAQEAPESGSSIPTVQVGGDTLTWDGNTEGRYGFMGDYPMWLISSQQPSIDSWTATYVAGNESFTVTSEQAPATTIATGIQVFGGYLWLVSDEGVGVDLDGLVIEKPGIYAPSEVGGVVLDTMSLTIPGFVFGSPKIDPAYLYQPDWNQNDETAAGFIKNRPFYSENTVIFPEQELTFADQGGQIGADVSYELILSDGDLLNVTIDGVSYTTKVTYTSLLNGYVFGNVVTLGLPGFSDTGEPFVGMASGERFVLVGEFDEGEHNVLIIKETVVKLPSKFIEQKTTPIFYRNSSGTDRFIYKDSDCTVKAKKDEISIDCIVYLLHGGVQYRPIYYEGVINDYATLIVSDGSLFVELYSEEYAPETT